MAALFRNSNIRLSAITDAISRLQLQHLGSFVISRQPGRLRFITQSCPNFLKDQTRASISETTLGQDQERDHSHGQFSTKPSENKSNTYSQVPILPLPQRTSARTQKKRPPYPRWTEEEDAELLRLAQEGKSVYDIYENHFPHRSLQAVRTRITNAIRVERIRQGQVDGGVRSSKDESSFVAHKVMAKAEPGTPLRQLYTAFKAARLEEWNADKGDDTIQRPVISRIVKGRKGKWTPQEDDLLERLMQAHIDVPRPAIWTKVSGGNINGSRLLRDPAACARRWRDLHPPTSFRTGAWTKEEELRFQQAISEQFGGKYQVVVDALVGKPRATENPLGKWRPDLQQLPDQAGLPILKQGSRRLGMLNWIAVAEKVKSRDEWVCRDHFYGCYHNGAKGRWTEEELKRAKEGIEMFGKEQHWKIAEHVGTRTPNQVNMWIVYRKRAMKDKSVKD